MTAMTGDCRRPGFAHCCPFCFWIGGSGRVSHGHPRHATLVPQVGARPRAWRHSQFQSSCRRDCAVRRGEHHDRIRMARIFYIFAAAGLLWSVAFYLAVPESSRRTSESQSAWSWPTSEAAMRMARSSELISIDSLHRRGRHLSLSPTCGTSQRVLLLLLRHLLLHDLVSRPTFLNTGTCRRRPWAHLASLPLLAGHGRRHCGRNSDRQGVQENGQTAVRAAHRGRARHAGLRRFLIPAAPDRDLHGLRSSA